MRKLFAAIFSVVAIAACVAGLSACKKDGHEHVWDGGEITAAATCTSTGVKTYKCTVEGCNETYTETIEKTAHSFTGAFVKVEGGKHAHKCANCEAVDTANAVDHDFVEDTSRRVDATCHSDGIKYMVCSACHEETTEAITDRPAHTFTGVFVKVEGGKHARKCANCEAVDTANAVDHDFVEDTSRRVDATCHSDGIKTFVCSDCHEETTEAITERPAHTFTGDWVKVDDETHTHKCANCEAVDTANAVDHNFVEDTSKRVEATCHSDGEKTFVCSDCHDEKIETITDRPAHTFTGAFVKVEGGKHAHKCANCEAVDTANAVDHNFVEDTSKRVEATCHSDGEKTFVCSDCHDEKIETITDRPAHTFTGAFVKVDDDTHAHKCANCEAVDTENAVPHNLTYTDITDAGHATVCSDCGYKTTVTEHEYISEVITEAAFNQKGETKYTCACGHNYSSISYKEADFGKDFTVTPDSNHLWSYGTADYTWNPTESFTFNAATDKNNGNDGWKIDNNEIKSDWISSPNNVAIGYKISEGVTKVHYDLSYTGGGDDPGRFIVRIWRMAEDGTLVGNNIFIPKNEEGGAVSVNGDIETTAGETIYVIFFHEGGWDQVANFNYVITNVTPDNP